MLCHICLHTLHCAFRCFVYHRISQKTKNACTGMKTKDQLRLFVLFGADPLVLPRSRSTLPLRDLSFFSLWFWCSKYCYPHTWETHMRYGFAWSEKFTPLSDFHVAHSTGMCAPHCVARRRKQSTLVKWIIEKGNRKGTLPYYKRYIIFQKSK